MMMFGKSRRPTVVIIGLGDTGVLVATRLAKTCRVIGISTKPNLVSGQELGKRLADLEWWQTHYNTPLARFKGLRGVEIILGKAEGVSPDDKAVTITESDGTDRVLSYDYLIVASGTANGFWRDDAVNSDLEIRESLEREAARVREASTVAVIGGGPSGVSSALNIQRAYPSKNVVLCFSSTLPLPGYHEEARAYYERELSESGVTLLAGHRALVPNDLPSAGLIDFDSRESISADTIIWTLGRRTPHTAFLPTEFLDEEGFVKTRPTLEVEGSDTIFAIGDVASTDPARSSARNWAYGILVHNLKRKVAGKSPNRHYLPPAHRWGSIAGPQADGLTLHQANGKRMRLSRRLVDRFLLPTLVRRVIYRGVDSTVDAARR